jgi:hypothetical protein
MRLNPDGSKYLSRPAYLGAGGVALINDDATVRKAPETFQELIYSIGRHRPDFPESN